MTDVYVISGFLGAGKTTLIKTMVRSAFKNKKLVVIENDFGEAGIDAGLLKECNLAVTSLSDGCICCSLTGDFEKAMERILKDYIPDAVLVEPSGVGRLSDLIKICLKQEDRGLIHLKRTITVVDIRSFPAPNLNATSNFVPILCKPPSLNLKIFHSSPFNVKSLSEPCHKLFKSQMPFFIRYLS